MPMPTPKPPMQAEHGDERTRGANGSHRRRGLAHDGNLNVGPVLFEVDVGDAVEQGIV